MNIKRYWKGLFKPWGKQRVKWAIIVTLTTLFGRRVEIEGAVKPYRRVLPVIWNRKLYLLGLQHHVARIEFDRQYRTRIICPPPHVSPYPPLPPQGREDEPQGFMHVTALHCMAEEADRIMSIWSRMAGEKHTLVLGYGGPQTEFGKIRHEPKFYVPQNKVWASHKGGPISLNHIITEASRIFATTNLNGMIFTDGDAWPCRPGYLDALCLPPWKARVDFSSFRLKDITGTNLTFPLWDDYTRPEIEKWAAANSDADPNAPLRVLHRFGAFMYLSSEMVYKFLHHCADQPPLHNEVVMSTYMVHLGARYQSYEDFGLLDSDKWMRYRPNLNKEQVIEAIQQRIPLIHPVKNNEWIGLFEDMV